MGVDLSLAWKSGGNLGEIDGFDLEQARNEIREALNAREMPIGKVKFQDMGEYGSLIEDVSNVLIRYQSNRPNS